MSAQGVRRGESREFGIEIKEKQAENCCGVQLNFCKSEGDSETEREEEWVSLHVPNMFENRNKLWTGLTALT